MRKLLGLAIVVLGALLTAPQLAVAQNSLTMEAPPDYMINGLRIFDNNSMNLMDTTTYLLGTGRSITLQLGAPRDTGYNLAVLQTDVVATSQCGQGNDNQVIACLQGSYQACSSLSRECRTQIQRSRSGVTNQGACNSNISPVSGNIILKLSCSPGSRICGCAITQGQRIASQADKACPFTCQSWNPASHSCVGAPSNGCGTDVRPDPPAPKCPFTCQMYNPASNSCVGAPMNGC